MAFGFALEQGNVWWEKSTKDKSALFSEMLSIIAHVLDQYVSIDIGEDNVECAVQFSEQGGITQMSV